MFNLRTAASSIVQQYSAKPPEISAPASFAYGEARVGAEPQAHQASALDGQPHMPSRQQLATLLGKLPDAGILKVIRQGSGRRPQVLALAELVNV